MATAEQATATPAAESCHSHDHAHDHSHGGETCHSHAPQTAPAVKINVTEKAAAEVRRIISEQKETGSFPEVVYLRLRVVGGGCSGFQNKLDLDPTFNEKLDEKFDFHGVAVVVDKRSLMYLDGAKVDFHDDLNQRGFSITNPSAKSTCGCGSSFSM
jgi:iron-sulfur cluster insertion protein